jgi:flavin reductase (DIM6/NTAB) family NADH-FMN oxidoreductase RutF
VTSARLEFDPDRLGINVYGLLNSVVVPRPIAWVSTLSADGVANVAPHSFFTVASVQPPVLSWTSVGSKDSLRNALATGEFVVNVVTQSLSERVNQTATEFPADMSEFVAAGVTPEPSVVVSTPRVAESPVSIECRLIDTRDFGGGSTVVFGEVVHISLADGLLVDDNLDRPRVSATELDPVARLGRDEWTTLGKIFSLRRQPFPEWQAQQ